MKKLILLFIFACGLLNAAIAYVQGKSCNADATPVTCAFDSAPTGGNLIVVAIRFLEATGTVSSVTDSQSNSYSFVVTSGAAYGNITLIYYAKNITGGANTVSVAWADSWRTVVSIHEYSGIDTTAPLDKSAGAVGSSPTVASSGAQTTTQNDELIFGACSSHGASLSGFQGAGFTARLNNDSGGGFLTEDKIVSSTGSYSAFWGDNSSSFQATMATFKMTTAGAARRRVVIVQ